MIFESNDLIYSNRSMMNNVLKHCKGLCLDIWRRREEIS